MLSSIIFMFFPLLLLLTTTIANTPFLINQTCKTSSMNDPNIDYNFCIHSFDTAPSSRVANHTHLGLISINLLKHNVSRTTFIIGILLNNNYYYYNNKLDNCTKAGLRDCLELYSDAIPALREAARDYRGARFYAANVKVSSVMDASTTCEQGFGEFNVASPLTKRNNDTFQLSAIALSIINNMFS